MLMKHTKFPVTFSSVDMGISTIFRTLICKRIFIALFFLSRHYVKGNIPKIPGIETFPGRILHSHLFRDPEEFSGQTVVVLGAKSSGFDIAIEISWNASTVYLSSKSNK